MKMENAVMSCKIFDTFETKEGRTGVFLTHEAAERVQFYLSYKNDLDGYRIGSDARTIDVPVQVAQGRKTSIPIHMVDAGWGSLLRVVQGLRKVYLAHMYLRPLYRSMRGEEKKYDPTTVFADSELMLIEGAYRHFGGCDIHDVLRENDYQYERFGVYTRFHDDDGVPNPTIYNTPRTLNYYPDMNTIRVSWAVGGTPMDVVQYNDPTGESMLYIKSQPFQLKIQRVYQNEGWLSLREAMRQDEKLHAFVKQFYANGYGKSGERSIAELTQ
ncbi:hypothetical protein AVU38_gp207 [Ralstonia phage RSL2]|uniref:Uncharacterized protein n=1 Tax=Ralstonia phage RSL2 TaxID=1585840 RepID=A0A0A8J8H9_9CAUD|nr:hypothetical protein AVU38_gp207 [Ralstonia phage RSL2]BAQ02735.1 hypothetical protein [Ralstonia phage RSL2]